MPEIQTIYFGEKVKLYQEPMRERPSAKGPKHTWRIRDFYLEDLQSRGSLSIRAYTDYPFEWDMPARLLNQELNVDEVLRLGIDLLFTQQLSYLSCILSMMIPVDAWNNLYNSSMSKTMPLVCCLESEEEQLKVYGALQEVSQSIDEDGQRFFRMEADTWLWPEADPARLDQRWREFTRGLNTTGAWGRGEVLLIPNDSGNDFGKKSNY